MQRHNAGVVARMRLLDHVRPPRVERVEDDHETEQEQERAGRRDVDETADHHMALPQPMEHADSADGHDEGADSGQQRPRARVDEVIVVVLGM